MKLTVHIILSMIALTGCTDPDVVPETHISATPPPQASGTPAERFPLKTALFGDLHNIRVLNLSFSAPVRSH